jgi:hypothetical protein
VSEDRSHDGAADTISRRTPAPLDEGPALVLAVLLAGGSRRRRPKEHREPPPLVRRVRLLGEVLGICAVSFSPAGTPQLSLAASSRSTFPDGTIAFVILIATRP